MNIQVSNLGHQVTSESLRTLFASRGEVASAEIVMDAFTEKSRGFGYVEMPDSNEAMKAIQSLNKTEFEGKTITVEEAPAREAHKGSYKVGSGAVNVYRFKKN
jgi:RNA recognition motif-containing protein